MINLPVLRQLDIDGYGLFPGDASLPGLHAELNPGLKLILGANGLGKTTLVTMIYRMLTGPYDIPNIASGGDLGGRRIEAAPISRADRRIFGQRVSDDAQRARATLRFSLGETRVEVTRSLMTLEIKRLTVNGADIEVSDNSFEQLIKDSARLSSFGDWILALRYLIFYFEDRRALIWDASAQIQLLRLLFLPPDEAAEMSRKEREVLELDSAVRNRRYVLGREESSIVRIESSLKTAEEIRQQLSLLQKIQADEKARLEALNDELTSTAAQRETARLNALTAEQAHESAMRNLERLQLREIEAAFPDATETGKYIIGQILAEEKCLTCGSIVPEFAEEIRERIRRQRCPICGSPMDEPEDHRPKRDHSDALALIEDLEIQATASRKSREAAEKIFDDLLARISELNAKTANRSAEIDDLIRRLPPAEQKVHEQRSELATQRARLEADIEALDKLRGNFQRFVSEVNVKIAKQRDAIKTAFDRYASGFLIEECSLTWTPRKSRVGQTGEQIEFAAFELDMTGSNFRIPHRRTSPEQVSESQREFIDLSFRMALMLVASSSGSTLVIDAPESSLDAVFAKRAADVLLRFCETDSKNRLIVTSNLVDGDLIPELLKGASIQVTEDARIVDLLRIAIPTAATKWLHDDYEEVRQRLFDRAAGRVI